RGPERGPAPREQAQRPRISLFWRARQVSRLQTVGRRGGRDFVWALSPGMHRNGAAMVLCLLYKHAALKCSQSQAVNFAISENLPARREGPLDLTRPAS